MIQGCVSVRGQLVCRGPGQQDGLPDLKRGTDFIRGTEQPSHHGICVHETLPFAQFVAFGISVGLDELGRCDFRHTHSIVRRSQKLTH